MAIYIQKYPEQVEAIQFTGDNFNEVTEFCEDAVFDTKHSSPIGYIQSLDKNFYIFDYIEKFEYAGAMEYTIHDRKEFEEYYKLLK